MLDPHLSQTTFSLLGPCSLLALLCGACSSSEDSNSSNSPLSNASAGMAGAVGSAGGSGSPPMPIGSSGAAGMAGTASSAGSAGTAGANAGSNAGGAAAAGASGAAGAMTAGGSGGMAANTDERPWFSFFVTSMDGLLRQRYGDAVPADLENAGFGGDLGGLEGADAICTALAQEGNPGDTKTWHAFLSTAPGGMGEVVDAIDRIGEGPWYDWNNRLFAMSIADLTSGANGRPNGIDPQLENMFTDEYGNPIRVADEDNHDTLTGSGQEGRLQGDLDGTCQNWTFSGEYPSDTEVRVGHAWPRSENNGRNWISDHTVRGCMPGVLISGGGGAPQGDQRVGAGGGFGGFYCFALSSQ